jgi:PAS domain S-box-containing protein
MADYWKEVAMASELRKTGISVMGDMPWGTHFCHFYETKQDLLDTLVPYFKAGLESKEYCLWVVSDSDLITVEEATEALAQAVPDLERHISDENIEILNRHDWYFEQHALNLERAKHEWDATLKRALARGYEGLRASADTFWLAEKDWKDFFAYEKQVNDWITNQSMTVMCTYPLAKSRATEILDVVQSHQFAIARRHGEWEVIEAPQLIQAKAEIKKLNEDLEQRVVERTNELRVANEELKKEIVERKQVEEQLRQSESQLAEAQHLARVGSWNWDLQSNALNWSDELYRIFGVDPQAFDPAFEDVVTEFIRAEDRALVRGVIESSLKTQEPFSFYYRILRPDGEERVIYSRGSIVSDEHGKPVRMFGAAQDVTERKQAEEALKKSQHRLEEAQRIAHVGHWERDLKTGLITWSDEIYRILGLPPQENDSPPAEWRHMLHPEDRERVFLVMEEVQRGIRRYDVEYRIVRPDGEVRFLHSQGDIIRDEQGRPVRAFGIAQDITERKQAEEKLEQSSEQLRALSARLQSAREEEGTRIAREIHDELGATLTSLRWDLESFDKVISESKDGPQLQTLRERIEAMLGLTETTISSVRRISSELRPSVLDDLGLAAAIEWQAQQFQARTGITCRCDCSLENLNLSREQSTAVFRIFQEALTNILRHAQATSVDITMQAEAGELVFAISDNGRGITEDEKSGSQSLGLLGMQERAQLIGAKLDVNSDAGKGTVVTVRVALSGSANH